MASRLILPKQKGKKATSSDFQWFSNEDYLQISEFSNRKFAELLEDRYQFFDLILNSEEPKESFIPWLTSEKRKRDQFIIFEYIEENDPNCLDAVQETTVHEAFDLSDSAQIVREEISKFDPIEFRCLTDNEKKPVSDFYINDFPIRDLFVSIDVSASDEIITSQLLKLVKAHRNRKLSNQASTLPKKPKSRSNLEYRRIVQLIDIHLYAYLIQVWLPYKVIRDVIYSDRNEGETDVRNYIDRDMTPLLDMHFLSSTTHNLNK